MKKKEKRMILILLVVLVIAVVIFVVSKNKKGNKENTEENKVVEEFVQVLEDGTRLNTSTKLNEMKKFEGLEFGNIQLTNSNGQSVLLADVKNTTQAETGLMLVDVTLYDKNGNELGTVGGIISPLKPGESKQFNTSMTIDYANAYDFKITKK